MPDTNKAHLPSILKVILGEIGHLSPPTKITEHWDVHSTF
jgi:hypothetical protein